MAEQLARTGDEHVEACVECARGAHRNCGRSIDHARDRPAACPCRLSGHAGGPWPL